MWKEARFAQCLFMDSQLCLSCMECGTCYGSDGPIIMASSDAGQDEVEYLFGKYDQEENESEA